MQLFEESPLLRGYPATEMDKSIIFQSVSLLLSLMCSVIIGYLMMRIGAKTRQESDDGEKIELNRAR